MNTDELTAANAALTARVATLEGAAPTQSAQDSKTTAAVEWLGKFAKANGEVFTGATELAAQFAD